MGMRVAKRVWVMVSVSASVRLMGDVGGDVNGVTLMG